MEELELYLDTAKEMMDKALDHTKVELSKIRAGKAMPNMLDGLMVEYYGTPTPINQGRFYQYPGRQDFICQALGEKCHS